MARGLPAVLGSLHLNRSPLARALLASAALSAAVALSGCNTDGALPMNERATRPLSEKMVSEIQSKQMDRESPILVRTFKEESELEIWKQDRTGRFALLKTYPICRWSGELGPKIKEGDRQAPEGFYTISPGQMNPNSQYYLSFDLGYPNAFDRAHGRTGANLMVHGDCSSRGCYSMTDEQISEIYALGRDAFFGGQKSFQVQAYPFRMTPQNLAKHRGNPHIAFWKMLKKGSDHFEVSHLEPKVNVCEKRYVFDAEQPAGSTRALSFSASAKCPVFEVPEEIARAVEEKRHRDEIQTVELIRRGTPVAPIRTNADGGMHPVFVAAVKRNEVGVAPAPFSLASVPGTIPVTVRPPRIPELADAPVVAAAMPVPQPAEATPARMAIAEPDAPSAKPAANTSNMFGRLFSSNSTNVAEKNEKNKKVGPIDQIARLIGLSNNDATDTPAEAAPMPKPKPAIRQTHATAPGAVRPKQPNAEPAKIAEAQSPAPTTTTVAAAAAPAPARSQMPAPTNTTISGAAPVLPAGAFDSRWSAFR